MPLILQKNASSILQEEAQINDLSDLERMAKVTQKILRASIDAFLKEDVKLARHVLKLDDEVDTLNVNFFYQMKSVMQADPQRVGVAMDLTIIAHNLERIADLSGNLAEEVIFLAQGKEVRHRKSLN
jgi:phosphate transport system protein